MSHAAVPQGGGSGTSVITFIGIIIWLIAAIFYMYEFFLRTFVGALAHQIIPQLHLNLETYALLGSGYYLTYAVMQIPVGIIIDKIGIKKSMIFSTALCGISTIFFSFSTGFETALISRVIMGFASSFAFVCLLVIALNCFPKKNFGFFSGLSQLIGTLGPVIAGGPLVLFLKNTGGNWRYLMIMVGLIGFILAALSFIFIKNNMRGNSNSAVIINLQRSGIIKKIIELLKNKQAWFVAIYSACAYAPIATLGAIWGTDFIESKGISQVSAASAVSAIWLGLAIGCPIMGALSDKIKKRIPIMVFQGILGVVIGITLIFTIQNITVLTILFFLLGLAGAGQNIGFAAIAESVKNDVTSTAFGLNNGLMLLVDTFLPFIFGALVAFVSHGKSVNLQFHDFSIAILLIPLLYLISTIMAVFFIKETHCRSQKEMIIVSAEKE